MLKDPPRDKWRAWLNDFISDEMVSSAIDRHVFRRTQAVLGANAIARENRLVALLAMSYIERQALFVRRQVESRTSDCPRSLVVLMDEVGKYASHFQRASFLAEYTSPQYVDAWRDANALFDRFVEAGRPDVVSPTVIAGHISDLRAAAAPIEVFATKWLAHADRSRPTPAFSLNDLDACLDLLYERWHQYHALAAVGPIDADIEWLAGTEWEEIFDTAWRKASASDPS